jgi:PAS domain S-box-containing protein
MSSCDLFILSGRELSHSDENPKTTCDLFLPSVDMKLQSNEPFADMTSELIDFFQNAPIALHWLSDAGVILWANNFEMLCLGYVSDEYIGHNITEFLLPGEEVQLLEVFTDLLAGQTIRNKSFLFRAKNGGTKYLTVDSNVYFHEDGSFRHTR